MLVVGGVGSVDLNSPMPGEQGRKSLIEKRGVRRGGTQVTRTLFMP
jgi:hypothetical protein